MSIKSGIYLIILILLIIGTIFYTPIALNVIRDVIKSHDIVSIIFAIVLVLILIIFIVFIPIVYNKI